MQARRIGPLSAGVLAAAALLAAGDGDTHLATLYQQSCAACHGADGSGLAADSPLRQTFDPLPADLGDPLFNSREPGADWFLVVKHGGPALGLSSQMPAFAGALSDPEIEALVGYLKTLADSEGYPPGDLNFLRPVDTIKAFPEDEALVLSRYTSDDEGPDQLVSTLYYARRVGRRSQVEVKANHVDEGDSSDLEEVELGYKWTFFHDLDRALLLAAGLEVEVPVNGGDDPEVWIPYFSFGKGWPSFSLQGTLRSHLPSDDAGAGDVKLSTVVHWLPSPWPRHLFPGLEATLTVPFEGEEEETVTLIPQAWIGLSKGGHVALGLGAEIPVRGLDYDYRLRAFLLWDYADGALWKRWR